MSPSLLSCACARARVERGADRAQLELACSSGPMVTTAVTTTATMSPVARSRKHQTTVHSSLAPCITRHNPSTSLDTLDLSSASPAAAFASLHVRVLSCLADIEASLSQLESPLPDFDLGQAISRGELKVEEVRAWAKDGLEILKQIKAELRSHLPEFSLDPVSIESYVSARLHDLSDSSNLKRVTSHLPELPCIPRPEQYIFNLSAHLKSLHSHLSSSHALSHMAFPSFPSTAKLSELIDMMISSDRLPLMLRACSMSRTDDALGRAATEVAHAIERSVHGAKLITYGDLPSEWRNNPFVTYGYRFVPNVRAWAVTYAHVSSQLYPSS
jgi:adiponectin receptor